MVVTLKFMGSNCLRQRITLAQLTGKAILIEEIRPDEGLNEHEENLLQLIEKITSGSKINISKDKSRLQFHPGTIVGGQITHNCHNDRSITYYLEVLLHLAAFTKSPFEITLNGVTNDQIDPNIDALKASAIPLMKRFFGDVEGTKLDIKVNSRGFKPDGGGQVLFTCPVIRQLQPIQLTKTGMVKRVRGVAVAARVSPQMANRMIDSSKGMLLQFIPDIYIYSDHNKGKTSGLSPGFSLSLTAETTEGCFFTASAVSNSKGSSEGPSIPEDVAKEATYRLLHEIYNGGCVDSIGQSLAFTLMAFNQKDISQLRMGPLTTYSILYLRNMKQFCSITFRLENCDKGDEIIATCEGLGFKNVNRSTY